VAQLSIEVTTPAASLTLTAPTVSIGGAVPPVGGTDLASLLHAADTALYAAKRAGRNTVRIEVAPPPPAPVPLTGRGDGRPGADR
jgi:GGDEF domain-containing protein